MAEDEMLGSITDSMYMYLSKLWEIVEDGGAWHAAVHGVAKSWTWLRDWTTTTRMFGHLERWKKMKCDDLERKGWVVWFSGSDRWGHRRLSAFPCAVLDQYPGQATLRATSNQHRYRMAICIFCKGHALCYLAAFSSINFWVYSLRQVTWSLWPCFRHLNVEITTPTVQANQSMCSEYADTVI